MRQFIFEYYQLVFPELGERLNDEIESALLTEPSELRKNWWQKLRGRTLSGEGAWGELHSYAETIERTMADIISEHSIFYWIHLYRRIGVALHSGHEQKTDQTTVALVRGTLETAFLRYSQIPASAEDIKLSSQLAADEIMGGMWIESARRLFSKTELDNYTRALASIPQWVVHQFTDDDFVNLYRLEGLAYEYWLACARMRSVGKGARIAVFGNGDVGTLRDDDLDWLTTSYDDRSANQPWRASAIGAGFGFDDDGDLPFGLFAQYNTNRKKFSELLPPQVASVEFTDLIVNFIYGKVDIDSYIKNHVFAEASFHKHWGFRLHSLCGYIAAIGINEFANACADEDSRHINLLQLYQRAYSNADIHGYFEQLESTAMRLMDKWFGIGNHNLVEDAPKVREFLTLSPNKQKLISLWSQGPQYAFFFNNGAVIIDQYGLAIILANAFFGVAYNSDPKGQQFEAYFRRRLIEGGIEVLPYRQLRNTAGTRETDAAVKVNDKLILCECRAMERPLDYQIGRPKTISTRIADLDSKVEKAITIGEFVTSEPVGVNYDIRWAAEVLSLVVSPFVEWIWSRDERLWVAHGVPRVLSADEAIRFIRSLE